MYTNNQTGLEEEKVLSPYGKLIKNWGYCASFELSQYQEGLRMVEIKSPIEVNVLFHSKDQSNIPIELSTQVRFDGKHEVTVTVDKTIDVNQNDKPRYNPDDHGGKMYGDYDYTVLNKMFLERFNCTTPFIPQQFRDEGEICLNRTVGKTIHTILRQRSASFNPNMFKENYHSIPPCVYHTFSVQQSRTDGTSVV